MAVTVDVEVHHEGSIILIEPKTPEANDVTWWAGSVVVEWRYADDILFGMRSDGLEVI